MLAFLIVLGSLRLDSPSSLMNMVDATILDGFVQNVDAASSPAEIVERPYDRGQTRMGIARQAQAHTAIPDRPRLEIITYTVQAGDTADKIAVSFGLQPTTLLWSNPEMEKMPDLLRVGQVLTILPLDGAYYTVGVSDTLQSIADVYSVDVNAIANCPFNEIPQGGILAEGLQLVVPGGTKPYESRDVITAYDGPVPEDAQVLGLFSWPTSGVLTQGYWYGHRAIDIGGFIGEAIRASDGGYVSYAGWTDIGYGYLIVLDHQNGFQTYYAHLSNILVDEGQTVAATQVIGEMGSTGNSTGPHLHFEIRYDGYPTNPLIYLP